jgi:DNA-binding response OmpR family regulator
MVERAFEAGCDDYVTKPLDKMELLSKVRTYLA